MQELWNVTLVVELILRLRGGILTMCREYKTFWKPNLKHCYPVVYAAPRLLGLVLHGCRRSPGYHRVIP